ncbi:formyltransferase [Curvibacter sp. HBC28]|uniref:Formyltransferase n=1 Tax=Curvibacter microcysteis TaxID=3026419 RepID=A0ABT5MA64_9BURK|nr:formyltransferase [Curvibacter sp. HBC28]MDD0813321.1 formyltransferase [Curvibacter sp. HBC28]
MSPTVAAPASQRRPSAIVFAYHNVGVRLLKVLLDGGVDVKLVVTHSDNPNETIWFASVAQLAAEHGLPCITPDSADAPELLAQAQQAAPDFVFSFYYRYMLGQPLLDLPRHGAFNLHGSLLPRYRGRAPVNWAVVHGQREIGASLHVMNVKPDHGALIDQQAVPILSNDTAREVFDKVTLAAELVLARSLPGLLDGSAPHHPQQHIAGQYFGRRTPEDGRIPAHASAWQIHNLVRGVAPPDYPGAFFEAQGRRVQIDRSFWAGPPGPAGAVPPATPGAGRFQLSVQGAGLVITGADGQPLPVRAARLDGEPLDAARLQQLFGPQPVLVAD